VGFFENAGLRTAADGTDDPRNENIRRPLWPVLRSKLFPGLQKACYVAEDSSCDIASVQAKRAKGANDLEPI